MCTNREVFGSLCVRVVRRKGRATRGIAPSYRTISRTRGPSGSQHPCYSSGDGPVRYSAREDDIKIGAAFHLSSCSAAPLPLLSAVWIAPFLGGSIRHCQPPTCSRTGRGGGRKQVFGPVKRSFFFCGRAIDLLARCSSDSGQSFLHHRTRRSLYSLSVSRRLASNSSSRSVSRNCSSSVSRCTHDPTCMSHRI